MTAPYDSFDSFAEKHSLKGWAVRHAHRRGLLPPLPRIGARHVIPHGLAKKIIGILVDYKYINRSPEECQARKKNGYVRKPATTVAA